MKRLLCASAWVLGMGSSCLAGTIDVRPLGGGLGANVQLTLGGTTAVGFAGQTRLALSNGSAGSNLAGLTGTFIAFSADPLVVRPVGGTMSMTSTRLVDLQVASPFPAMDQARAQAVFNLFAGSLNRERTSAAWAAAFQMVLWDIIYDGPGALGLESGVFQARRADGSAFNAAVMGMVNELFATVSQNVVRDNLRALGSPSPGAYLFEPDSVVPLPPAVWAGLGTLGVVWAARRVRRPR